MDNLDSKIRTLISERLNIPEDRLTPTADFVRDLGADSLDSVELLMALEEQFGIEVPDDAADRIHCMRDVVEFVKARQITT